MWDPFGLHETLPDALQVELAGIFVETYGAWSAEQRARMGAYAAGTDNSSSCSAVDQNDATDDEERAGLGTWRVDDDAGATASADRAACIEMRSA